MKYFVKELKAQAPTQVNPDDDFEDKAPTADVLQNQFPELMPHERFVLWVIGYFCHTQKRQVWVSYSLIDRFTIFWRPEHNRLFPLWRRAFSFVPELRDLAFACLPRLVDGGYLERNVIPDSDGEPVYLYRLSEETLRRCVLNEHTLRLRAL